MPILKSVPIKKNIHGREFMTSQSILISENEYKTNGEYLIVVKNVDTCDITLNSDTTEHIVIKSLTKVVIRPDKNKIDEKYSEIEINNGACVEFYFTGGCWYILSSDGLKIN